jgi:SAM-dependent methyltransferase
MSSLLTKVWKTRHDDTPIVDDTISPPREQPDGGVQASSDRLISWPSVPPAGYLGQLAREFQTALANERRGLMRDDCRFYHTIELPDGEVVSGPWDLRGREREYLGNLDLARRRVLEFGPATGHLTYFMERCGARVVAFDVGYDVSIDLHPAPGNIDTRKLRLDHARMVSEMQNSWWYLHRLYRSTAQMVYGDIYALPGDIGDFDVSVFAAILLHLRSPIAALEQAARRTRDAIVVTDTWAFGRESLYDDVMRIFPFEDAGRWTVWWSISAGAVVRMLETLGFRRTDVTEHTQRHQFGHDPNAPYQDIPMYTVVGRRG